MEVFVELPVISTRKHHRSPVEVTRGFFLVLVFF